MCEQLFNHVVALETERLEAEAAEQSNPAFKPNVLIVDDEPTMWELLGYVLEDHGYALVNVASGESALEEIDKTEFHVVITDKNMPGITGLDVMKAVKSKSPLTQVVLMTGFSNKDAAIAAVNLGAAAYLEKPFPNVDEVGKLIHQLVGKYDEARQRRRKSRALFERNREFWQKYSKLRKQLADYMGD